MKVTGLVLVVIGAVALALQGFSFMAGDSVVTLPAQMSADSGPSVWASPLVGGISVVGGLILLAMGTDRRLA